MAGARRRTVLCAAELCGRGAVAQRWRLQDEGRSGVRLRCQLKGIPGSWACVPGEIAAAIMAYPLAENADRVQPPRDLSPGWSF